MHEGYHADDIFMMVEDEFQAVAQTFTRHLHHAEYVRMKKKARTAPPKVISQPHHGMRAEAEKKLEAKHLHKRQTSAVKSMARKAEGSSTDDEEETRGNDPWQGTSLAGLMANDSPRKRTALVGLQQIPSTTRAAKGFGPGERDSRTTQEDSKGDTYVDLDEPLTRKAATTTQGKLPGSGIQEPLNNRVLRQAVRPSGMLTAQPTRSNPRSEDVTKAKFASHDCDESSKPSSCSLRRTVASFDDFYSEDSHELTTRSNSAFNNTSTTRSKEKKAAEKDKRSRLNEIPTFLV
jgi:hypothetical protein